MGTQELPKPSELQRAGTELPREGENGVFTQNWFPLCLSTELGPEQILGCQFLDGKVVVYRDANAAVHVLSAYCPHLGADLSVGDVCEGNIRCPFHHWQYSAEGRCVKTAVGAPPPPSARLFKFPAQEKYGLIWAFNGTTPLWDLPSLPIPEERLLMKSLKWPRPFQCEGWVFSCNTLDLQHIEALHGVRIDPGGRDPTVRWLDFGFDYDVSATHQNGEPLSWTVGIRGTSFFWRHGDYDGGWLGNITAFSLPCPGQHRAFACVAVERGPGEEERLQRGIDLEIRTLGEDEKILNTIHYRPGTLVRQDRELSRYLKYVREFPRAHPAAAFIN